MSTETRQIHDSDRGTCAAIVVIDTRYLPCYCAFLMMHDHFGQVVVWPNIMLLILKLKFSLTFCEKYLESWDRDEDLLGIFSNVMAQRMNMSFGV